MKKDKKVDAYISGSESFAIPILRKIRTLMHKACPVVEETIKWSFPVFIYKGSILANMASFKSHCAFGFWLGDLIPDVKKIMNENGGVAMGQFGRIASLKDLPADKQFIKYVKEAMKLTDDGAKPTRSTRTSDNKEITVPDYFLKAIKKNKEAFKTFNLFSPGKKREYVEWITEAKTEETRNKRMNTAIEWMEEGKDRNWKYKKDSKVPKKSV